MILQIILYLIPGFLLTLLMFKRLDILKLIGFTIGLSISINILMIFILSFISLSKFSIIASLILISTILLFFIIKDKHFQNLKNIEFKRSDMIVFLVLIFIFLLIFKVHLAYTSTIQDPHNDPQYIEVKNLNYPYPIHADEWSFLTWSIFIKEDHQIFTQPFTKEPYPDLEVGSHLFLSELYIFTDIDPVTTFQYFPAIFAVISSLFLFLLAKKLYSYKTAIFSMLFFASIQSNTNLLGNWFFTPLTFSLFFIFMFTYLLLEKKTIASIFILIISLITYPFAFIINFFIFLFNIRFNIKRMIVSIFIGFLSLIYLLYLRFNPLQYIIFTKDWTPFIFNYNLITFFGIVGFILALIGFYKKRYLLLFTLPFFINVLLFQFFRFTILMPYERSFFYYLVSLAIPAAIGLDYLIKIFSDKKIIKNGFLKKFIVFIFTIGIFTVQFNDYYDIKEKDLVLLHLIQDKHYKALEFIKDLNAKDQIVLADSLTSIAVYPISKKTPFSTQASNLQIRKNLNHIYSQYLSANCDEKLQMIDRSPVRVDYIISDIAIDCSWIIRLYDKGLFIYTI